MNEGTRIQEEAVFEKNGMQCESCPEPIQSDAGCDYTLPDYLPEIRKILSVRAEVLPAAQYESVGGVETGGTVTHSVLYTDGEGKLAALPLHADYTLSFTGGEHTPHAAVIDTSAVGTVCRLGGPRKISLRTRLDSRVRLYADESVAPELRGMGSEGDAASLEILAEPFESERVLSLRSPEIALSASMRLDGTGEGTRAVWSGGGVLVNECRAERGALSLRGEVWLRVLLAGTEGSPYALRERIPFDTRIEHEEIREGDSCVCHGRILSSDIAIAVGEGEADGYVSADVTVEVEGLVMTREQCAPVRELYSTAYEMTCQHRTLTYRRPLGAAMGHYTVSGARSRTDCDGEDAATVVDAHGRVELGSVTAEGGRAVISGRVLADLIFTAPPEGDGVMPLLLSAPMECPFRIESDLRVGAGVNPSFICHADLVGARGRIEDHALSVDCEIALWVRAYEKKEMRILASAEPAGALPEKKCGTRVRVVYPQKGDSLFSLAGRYHQKRAAVAAANGLSPEALALSASPASLDGVHHLLIEE